MTTPGVAVVTDVLRDGRPVIGYGCNANGRYAAGGPLRERFIPWLLRVEAGTNLDPQRVWHAPMTGEKPGGHDERTAAVGTLDMAARNTVAKIEGRPLYRVFADCHNGGAADEQVFIYAAGAHETPVSRLCLSARRPVRTTADCEPDVGCRRLSSLVAGVVAFDSMTWVC